MKLGTWALLVVAIAMLAALAGVWHGGRTQNALSLVESAKARMATSTKEQDNYPIAMRELDTAVDLAEASGDAAAAREALAYRAELLELRGARGQAARDYERLLQAYQSGDPNVIAKLARCRLALEERSSALELCDQILSLDPDNAEARSLRGIALFQEGQAWLTSAQRLLDEELSQSDAERGFKLAERVAALDPADPLRPALLHDLHELFPSSRSDAADKVVELIEEVSQRWVQARSSFAGSFETEVRPEAVYGLIDILYRSGRLIQAVDFGLVARNLKDSFSPQTLQVLVLSMNEMGRPKVASKLVGDAPDADVGLPFEFRARLAKILYDAKLWNRLMVVGWRLHEFWGFPEIGERAVSYADFYQGLGEVREHREASGHALLERYVGNKPSEPFPGALAVAWSGIAEAERSFKRPLAERTALEASISLDKDLSGDIWLRLAELQTDAKDPASNVERSLTEALRLLPMRASEILPLWRDAGARAQIEQQRDTHLLWEELRREGRWYPARESSAYERLELARMSLDAGEAAGCYEACDSLLREWKDFLPALDLAIEAELKLKRHGRAAELMLRRLASGGPDTAVLHLLRKVPVAELNPSQVLAMMRADPRHSGILTLGAYQAERGGGERVLNGLLFLGFDDVGDDGRLLAARILMNLERDAEALPLLAAIAPGSKLQSTALRLRVEIAARSGDHAALESALERLRSLERFDEHELLPAALELYECGRLEEARALARILDGSSATRGASTLIVLAQLEHLLGQTEAARECFERLRALSDSGDAELGLLLLDAEARVWTDLPQDITRLEATRAPSTPLARAIRLALAERLDEAAAACASAGPAAQRELGWVLLRGCIARLQLAPIEHTLGTYPEALADTEALLGGACYAEPRDLLCLLLASEQQGWEHWAAFRARVVGASECGPLGALLHGVLLARADHYADAKLALQQAALARPLQVVAWDELEELERAHDDDPESADLIALRTQRRRALGGGGLQDPEEVLLRAREVIDHGASEVALPLLTDMAARHPEVPLLSLEAARARTRLSDWGGALTAWSHYAEIATTEALSRRLEEWLQLIERAQRSGKIGPARAKAELEALALRLPHDPLVALARANAEIDAIPQAPAIGIGRAFALLDAWRAQHPKQPIDSLREGAGRRWYEFYLALDPRRAEDYASGELALDPGDLDPWLMVGEAQQTQGRLKDALTQFDAARTMIPDGRIVRHIADIVADLGSDHNQVEQMLERARKMDRAAQDDPDLLFIRARSLVNSGPASLGDGIAQLFELWSKRASLGGRIAELDIGQELGTAMLHRLGPNDARRARLVLEAVLPQAQDPMRKDLLRALALIARRQEAVEAELAAAGAASAADATDAALARQAGAASGTSAGQ